MFFKRYVIYFLFYYYYFTIRYEFEFNDLKYFYVDFRIKSQHFMLSKLCWVRFLCLQTSKIIFEKLILGLKINGQNVNKEVEKIGLMAKHIEKE